MTVVDDGPCSGRTNLSSTNSKRGVSLDSSYSTENGRRDLHDKRTVSNESNLRRRMKPLSSVDINPCSHLHPLSHMRSCSEFGPAIRMDSQDVPVFTKRGNITRLFRWATKKAGVRKPTGETRKLADLALRRSVEAPTSIFESNRIACSTNIPYSNRSCSLEKAVIEPLLQRHDTSDFFHANMFDSAVRFAYKEKPRAPSVTSSLLDGGLTARQLSKRLSRCSVNERELSRSVDRDTSSFFFSWINSSTYKEKSKKMRSNDRAKDVTYETQIALDVLFGLRVNARKLPMEIELKDLRDPSLVFTHGSYSYFPERTPPMINRPLHPVVNDNFATIQINHFSKLDLLDMRTWLPAFAELIGFVISCAKPYLSGPEDDIFYDAVRMQPFNAGAYLRGFLMAGFSNLFFNGYSLMYWRYGFFTAVSELSESQNITLSLLLTFLITHCILNMLQVPLRISIHYNFFQSSRPVDVEDSLRILRNVISGDLWLICRGLGWVQDILSLFGLAFMEVCLWINCKNESDPLKPLMVALSATVFLGFCIRAFVALIFTYSMHDPQVLAEARKRGLSIVDLDIMPTFVFTTKSDLNDCDCDCSICMNTFDMGDMLISLPCDNRHSFHATCIREWLTRQNSCPLCQKTI